MGFNPPIKRIPTEKKDADRRVINLWFAGFPIHCKPDIMRRLGCKFVESQCRNQTYDTIWGLFRYFYNIHLGGNIQVYKLEKAAGNWNDRPLIPHPIKGSSVNSMGKGFMGANKPSVFSDDFYGSVSC